MGRFLNSRAVADGPALSSVAVEPVSETPETAVAEVAAPPPEVASSAIATIGLYALCIYLISGYATDLSYRYLGTKPYLSMITGVVVFACFLLSGRALAALKSTAGKLWLGLGLWMCLSVLFSRWRGGSMELMSSYLPKQHLIVFYAAAFVVTIRDCRTLLRAFLFGSFVLLLSCFFFGGLDEFGRFDIAGNAILSNPNDLAMQLLLCLGFFLFLIHQPGLVGRVVGVIGMLVAAYYLILTGSRGGMLAAALFAVLWMLFHEKRLAFMMLSVPMILLLIAVTPPGSLHRLSLILVDPEETAATTVEEEKTISSQMARTRLLKMGVEYALKNPVFGIGPGRFGDALWEDGKKEGRHEVSLGPHNTYTQLAAECGFPALIMFVGAIYLTIRRSFRLYRATAKDPSARVVSAIAFACFVVTSAFSVDLFFHHMGYSPNVPTILALWICTDIAAQYAVPRAATAV